MRRKRRVILAGMVAGVPGQGGWVWAIMHWALGLRRLGHEVLLVEPVDRISSEVACEFASVTRTFGLADCAALVTPQRSAAGITYERVADFADRADVVLNVAGVLKDERLLEPVPVRAYLDLDPGYTQLWQEIYGIDMHLHGHTHFVTVGLNLGRDGCTVPCCGRKWIPVLPPVVLDCWWPATKTVSAAWTTVANWRGYGSVEHNGLRLGQKAHSWRRLMELPVLAGNRMAPALAIHPEEHEDIATLRANDWNFVDPAQVAATPGDYRRFVRGSIGEIAIAKEGYVVANTGWFSDRSACYLAAGRPVVAQDTGWTASLQAGEGLLSFQTAEEAAQAIRHVMEHYERHREAARRVASQAFDARRIIGNLMEEFAL